MINGTVKVSEETRKQVLEAIKATGFQPNELARALYKQSSNLIGLVVPDIVNPFFNELARTIEEQAHKNGYHILLCNSNNISDKEKESIDRLSRMKADDHSPAYKRDGEKGGRSYLQEYQRGVL